MRSITAKVAAPEINQSLSQVYTVITDLYANTSYANDAFFNAIEILPAQVVDRQILYFLNVSEFALTTQTLGAILENNATFEFTAELLYAKKPGNFVKWTVIRLYQGYQKNALLLWTGQPIGNPIQTSTPKFTGYEMYKSLFYENPQPMWIYDRATFRFIDVNEAAIALYGYTKEVFLQMTINDIRPESEREKLARHLNMLKPVKVDDKTMRVHRKKDGTLLQVEVQSYNFQHNSQNSRLVIINDITQKERIKNILLESEERFRNMADNAPVMIWVSNADDKTTYVNKYWTDFTGISAAEAWGDGWNKVIHPGDIHIGIDEYKKGYLEKKPVSLMYRLRYRTGEYRWVLDQSIPRFLEDGTFLGYIGSLVDIHDYKTAEETIRFQARLIENASDVIISTDVNFKVVTWNKKAEDIYGIEAKDAVGQSMPDLILPDFLNTGSENSIQQLKEKGYWQGEMQYKKANGEIVYLLCMVSALKDPGNVITGYISVNHDITEKIKAEEKVRRNELKFKSILQNLIDVVFVLDNGGLIKYVTPSITTVLGYAEDELSGRDAFDFIHPEDLQRCKKLFRELQMNPGASIVADLRLKNKHGVWTWVETKGINKFADSVIDGIIISLYDISERKQSEQQLQAYSGHITNILNSITDGFIALDNKHNILWWNSIAEQLTGIKDVEVLGRNLWTAFPEVNQVRQLKIYRRSIVSKKAFSFELYIESLKGYFDINAYPSQQGLFIYFKDITHRKKQQMLLSLEKEVLELNINPDASLKNTTDYFLTGMEKFNPGLLCSVLLLDEDNKTMNHLSAPSLPPGFIKKVNGTEIGPSVGSCGTAIFLRKTIIVSNIKNMPQPLPNINLLHAGLFLL